MKPNQSNHPLPDHDADLEQDAIWNLLEDATPREASPRFVQDTLRRVRLEKEDAKSLWWKSLLSPKPLLGLAGASLAVVAIVVSLSQDPETPTNPVAELPETVEDWNELEDAFAYELLSDAAEDPTLLSDGEIVALLY